MSFVCGLHLEGVKRCKCYFLSIYVAAVAGSNKDNRRSFSTFVYLSKHCHSNNNNNNKKKEEKKKKKATLCYGVRYLEYRTHQNRNSLDNCSAVTYVILAVLTL